MNSLGKNELIQDKTTFLLTEQKVVPDVGTDDGQTLTEEMEEIERMYKQKNSHETETDKKDKKDKNVPTSNLITMEMTIVRKRILEGEEDLRERERETDIVGIPKDIVLKRKKKRSNLLY